MNSGPIFDIGVVEGVEDGPSQADSLQQVRRQQQKDKRNGLLIAGLLVALAAAAFLGASLLGGDDEVSDAADELPIVEPTSTASGETLAATQTPTESSESAPSLIFEPPSGDHLRSDDVGLVFSEQLDTAEQQYGIAYVANEQFTVLDRRGITLPELEIAQDFNTVNNLALLTSDGRTWAIDASNRDRSFLVSNGYVVVVAERPDTVAVIRPDNPESISILSSNLPVPSVNLPEGSELLWVQNRGLIVMPRTGGTFEVSGTAQSLERINDARAVDASLNATAYERCDDQLSCSLFVIQGADQEALEPAPEIPLPFSADVQVHLSPSGAYLVAVGQGSSALVDLATTRIVELQAGDVTAIDWAPGDAFVAIVRGQAIEIIDPATEQSTELRLNEAPDQASLLVFASGPTGQG